MNTAKYLIKDYVQSYGRIMQFNKNKNTYIHGWYPFVEGYSKEFILSIIKEYTEIYSKEPTSCLEPFAGSGTTPLELQKLGIKCTSFEVSPFMYNLSSTKMETSYTVNTFNKCYKQVEYLLNNYIDDIEAILPIPNGRKIVEKSGLEEWNFNKEIMKGILDIKYAINNIKISRYRKLFKIALASILLDVSNVYRNGKCVSYKKDWKINMHYTRTEIHEFYLKKLNTVFYPDIIKMANYKNTNGKLFSNRDFCYNGDVRKLLNKNVKDNSVDLIITSPPYLNSRDYTDTYMLELRMLDLAKTDMAIRNLRKQTFRSHVQVKWNNVSTPDIFLLKNSISKISENKDKFWNESLLDMINGYFEDMNTLFKSFYDVMTTNGLIYFNVANSAYYGVEIKTDEIVAEIAERNGFVTQEIREARRLKPSSQQKDSIPYLRESVLLLKKRA